MSEFATAAAGIAEELASAPTAAAGNWRSDTIRLRDGVADGVVESTAGHDLYGGSAGIGWFLAHHARHACSAEQRAAARSAFEQALEASEGMLRQRQLSLYGGAAGVALAVEEGARAIEDPVLRAEAEQLAQHVAVAACTDRIAESDLISGKAGLIVALLAFAWARPNRTGALRPAVRILSEQLVEEAEQGWWGAAWPEGGDPGLCGLGHGASGIAWALAEAGAYLGDDRLREAARAALRYEAGRFDRHRGSWPDLRGTGSGKPSGWMDAWCHGAIGIGAVRWRLWEAEREPQLLAQATAAMATMRNRIIEASRAGPDAKIDATLCHGLGGSIELMLLAYEVTGRAEHLAAARKVGRLVLRLRDEQQGQWTVGLPGGRDVPGLFLGRAGIGTSLLRLDDPRAMPSPILPGLSSRRLRLAAVSQAVTLGMPHAG